MIYVNHNNMCRWELHPDFCNKLVYISLCADDDDDGDDEENDNDEHHLSGPTSVCGPRAANVRGTQTNEQRYVWAGPTSHTRTERHTPRPASLSSHWAAFLCASVGLFGLHTTHTITQRGPKRRAATGWLIAWAGPGRRTSRQTDGRTHRRTSPMQLLQDKRQRSSVFATANQRTAEQQLAPTVLICLHIKFTAANWSCLPYMRQQRQPTTTTTTTSKEDLRLDYY